MSQEESPGSPRVELTPDVVSARAGIYHLLAMVYVSEMDAGSLSILECEEPFRSLIRGEEQADLLGRLRAEYARLFLLNVFPYESAYVEDEVMLNTASTQRVAEAYRQAGYAPSAGHRVGAADHIGIELDFISHLASREAALWRRGARAPATELRSVQVRFLLGHLASWGPVFATTVARDARSSLYRELALFTAEFLLADLDLLMGHTGAPVVASEVRTVQAEQLPLLDKGLRELVQRFTRPSAAGFHLSREELFRLAGRLQLPLAPVERWLMLEQLFQTASRYDQLPALLGELVNTAGQAAETYAVWIERYPGAAQAILPWEDRALSSVGLLRRMQCAAEAHVRIEESSVVHAQSGEV